MKTLTTKWFKKWSSKAGLNNQGLLEAVENLGKGLSVVDLGSSLFKVRVKRANSGKSSGFRTIIAYQEGDRAVFLYGFAKNERDNIDTSELQYFKTLSCDLLALSANEVEKLADEQVLFNVEVEK